MYNHRTLPVASAAHKGERDHSSDHFVCASITFSVAYGPIGATRLSSFVGKIELIARQWE